ncbi:MAG: hypothetical protein ACI4U2_03955, partial [Christensenellaceae bacterium]
MRVLSPQHGYYEIRYRAKHTPFIDREQEPVQAMIVEANDPKDAKRQAERQLKSSGYAFVIVEQVKFLRPAQNAARANARPDAFDESGQSGNRAYADRTASPSSAPAKRGAGRKSGEPKRKGGKLWLLLIPLIIGVILLVVLLYNLTGNSPVEGTYSLRSISGNVECSANSDENYCVLEDGVCTLYFTLTEPAGSSVHTFSYQGNDGDDIAFEKDNIRM